MEFLKTVERKFFENAIAVRDSNSLWDFTAMTLTHLSKRDGVEFKVSATPESVKKKLHYLRFFNGVHYLMIL